MLSTVPASMFRAGAKSFAVSATLSPIADGVAARW